MSEDDMRQLLELVWRHEILWWGTKITDALSSVAFFALGWITASKPKAE